MVRLPPPHIVNPLEFGIEFIYAAAILFLCILIYAKTKELYSLTKHRGIFLFRTAFLFLGIAYFFQFVLRSVHLGLIVSETYLPIQLVFPLFFMITSFFSTLALMYLLYSLLWKKFPYRYFLLLSLIFPALVSVIALATHSLFIVALVQIVLVMVLLIIGMTLKKKSRVQIMYLLISIFWLIEIIVLHLKRALPYGLKIPLQLVSIAVFIYLWYRVTRWTK